MIKEKRAILSERVGYIVQDSGIDFFAKQASYPLGKLSLFDNYMTLSGPTINKVIKISYKEINLFKWRLFVGDSFGGIVIKHSNKKYSTAIGITGFGFTSRALYKRMSKIIGPRLSKKALRKPQIKYK